MLGPLTYLDAGLLIVCGLSGLLAMYRGLTREVLSILSWALAAGATLYFVLFHRNVAEEIAAQYQQNPMVVQVGIGVGIFVVVLILVHLITMRFSDAVLDSRVGMIDRMLGFVFGVARGFLLVVVAYLFFAFLAEEKSFPPWIKDAQSLAYIQSAGQSLQSALAGLLPEKLQLPGSGGGEQAPDTATGETQG
jgi:membrane protein required for colicin V production